MNLRVDHPLEHPMEIRAEVVIPFPRDVVYRAYRDRMDELVKYLPNIRKIDFQSRKTTDHIIEIVSVWHGGGDIPSAARAFLTESMLSWTDIGNWNEKDYTCVWKVEPHSFREAITAGGTNRYIETATGTTLLIAGNLQVDPKHLRGVPGFLAKSIAPKVEEHLVGRIKPNLVEVGEGVKKLLSSDQSA